MTGVLRELGQAVYDELQPALNPGETDGGGLAALVYASTGVPDDIWAAAITPDGPLEDLFDPAVCPVWALAWCAGIHGVQLPDREAFASLDAWATAARALITLRPARRRGGRDAMLAAVRGVLVPGALVDIARRTDPAASGVDSPYDITILTRGALLNPSAGTLATVVLAAAEPHRPRGHVLHHVVTTGTTWRDLQAAGTSWAALQAAGVTWADIQSGAFTA